MEQKSIIKFYAKLGKNASETFSLMQQVYGDDCLSRANVFLWHKRLSCLLGYWGRLNFNARLNCINCCW